MYPRLLEAYGPMRNTAGGRKDKQAGNLVGRNRQLPVGLAQTYRQGIME
jgi:hypothetical protein